MGMAGNGAVGTMLSYAKQMLLSTAGGVVGVVLSAEHPRKSSHRTFMIQTWFSGELSKPEPGSGP